MCNLAIVKPPGNLPAQKMDLVAYSLEIRAQFLAENNNGNSRTNDRTCNRLAFHIAVIEALQVLCEEYMIEFYEGTDMKAIHFERETIIPKEVRLGYNLRSEEVRARTKLLTSKIAVG